ncbi:hypothetical protein ACWATR_25115 [Nostoc sp. UIC 10890]
MQDQDQDQEGPGVEINLLKLSGVSKLNYTNCNCATTMLKLSLFCHFPGGRSLEAS